MDRLEKALRRSLDEGIINKGQYDKISEYAEEERNPWPQVAAYTLGGILLLGGVLWLNDDIWRMIHGVGLVALLFAASFVLGFLASRLWKHDEHTAALIFALVAVALMPAAVHHLWKVLETAHPAGWGIWHGVDVRQLAMTLATLGYGGLLCLFVPAGPMVLPLSAAFWYLCRTLAPAWLGKLSMDQEALISAGVGVVLMLAGFLCHPQDSDADLIEDPGSLLVDLGALFLWGATASRFPRGGWNHAAGTAPLDLAYMGLNLVAIVAAALLRRPFFAVLGGIGILHLLYFYIDVYFHNPVLLPWILLGCGTLVLGFGVWWGKRWRNSQKK